MVPAEFAHLLSLPIFVRRKLMTRASTGVRDRARVGIPGKGSGLKGAASAVAELQVLV